MSSIVNWLSNNGFSVPASTAEEKVRQKYPLLLHENETIEIAFGHSMDPRDKSYFTNRRVLLQDGKGLGTKRKNYKSIPYWSLDGFRVTTAGALDVDMEVTFYIRGYGSEKVSIATKAVDPMLIVQYMNTKVSWDRIRGCEDPINTLPPPKAFQQSSGWSRLIDQIGSNATQLDPGQVKEQFTRSTPILLENEAVDLAFKAGRDTGIMTDQRMIVVDVRGLTGKKIAFSFYAWRMFVAFAVETAGMYFDRDSEMTLYTNRADKSTLRFDFRQSKVNLFAVQAYLANKLLGKDESAQRTFEIPKHDGPTDPKTNWWFRENQRPMNPVEMMQYYKNVVPILQSNETVEFAFKGRRDILLFTTKRIIDIDPKGWKGAKIEYTSIPWVYVEGFGVQTAGKHLDQDAEARIWTRMMFQSGNGEDPPEPGKSFLEFDFNKNVVDVMVVKKYLSARILCDKPNLVLPANQYNIRPLESGIEKFLSRIGSDQQMIDPNEINAELHTSIPILLEKETVIMAFKAGRDLTLFTNKRILELDTKGWSGKKVAYTSLTYDNIRAFSVESAGDWDRDSEVDLYTGNRWNLMKWGLDFRKGKADIITIQKFLASVVLGSHEEAAEYLRSREPTTFSRNSAATGKNFAAWIGNNSAKVSASEIDFKLHSDPRILLNDEKVHHAFQSGRDYYVYTSLRIIKVDVQGMSGKKVEYKSYPWKWIVGFEVETAGWMDRDAEVYVYFDIPGKARFKQSILVKTSDIMEMHHYLSGRVLFNAA